MGHQRQLLEILSDGVFHSGQALAARLGVTRAAVWKLIRELTGEGVEIYAVRRRGYRLAEPLEFLDETQIVAQLEASVKPLVSSLEIFQHIDSTNTYLTSRAKCGAASGAVCLAEAQSAGRGRQGRSWVSPYGANLYLSLLWRFTLDAGALTGLSLATGVGVARALQRLHVTAIGLKWPNDVWWQRHKLGGILLEFGGESSGPCHVVAGIGLNVAMPKGADQQIDQPWVDLRTIVGPGRISRNQLAAHLINEIIGAYLAFEQEGFKSVREEWERLDLAAGHPITLRLPDRNIDGVARGVDESGALLVETATGLQSFLGGEISLTLKS